MRNTEEDMRGTSTTSTEEPGAVAVMVRRLSNSPWMWSPFIAFSCHSGHHFALGGLCEEYPHEPWCVHMARWQHIWRRSNQRHEEWIWYVQVWHTACVLHRPLVSRQETREGTWGAFVKESHPCGCMHDVKLTIHNTVQPTSLLSLKTFSVPQNKANMH